MAGPLKKCFNCRILLPEDSTNLTQCAKCQKNEEKYGKPGTCTFCQLNAAFHDKRCVWCSHAERKFGEPSRCGHCKLKCAFPRRESDKTDGSPRLCRLCIMQARQNNATEMSGIPVPKEKQDRTSTSGDNNHQSSSSHRHNRDHHHHRHRSDRDRHDRHHDRKRRHEEEKKNGESSSSGALLNPPLLPTNENGNGPSFAGFVERDHGEVVKHQKMEDEIRRLKALLVEKDNLIFEKDKQISTLKAENYTMEKKHRERVYQLNKEKEESIRAIEQIKKKKINQ